jgi:hypothetical protein
MPPAADLQPALGAAVEPQSRRAAELEQDSAPALPKLSLGLAVRPALPDLPLEPALARLPSALARWPTPPAWLQALALAALALKK